MFLKTSKKTWIILLITLILTAYQIIRLIVFANVYGGIYRDAGWYASVSRSLAERGTYTSMTSTLVDPTIPSGINVDDRFEVQDEEGRIWFFTVNGLGPGSIVPNAIILKLLGFGFWSLKAGPLLFSTLFLILASLLLYRVGGIIPVLLFFLFPIFYPHLLVYLGYDIYGEVPAIVYILLAYMLFIKATQSPVQMPYFFLSGLLAGLALLTKIGALFSVGSIFVLWLLLFWQKQTKIKHFVIIGLGFCLLPILWEVIQLVTLTQITDFETYRLHAAERYDFIFRTDGSSDAILQSIMGNTNPHFDVNEFILAKLLTVSVISHPTSIMSFIVFVLVMISGPLLAYLQKDRPVIKNTILIIWFGWLIHTAWFVGLSKIARVRRDWFALIFAVMLLCWLTGYFIQQAKRKPTWRTISIAGILTAILIINFVSQLHAVGFFIPTSIVETWRLNYLSNDTFIGKYEQQVPWLIIPRAQQEEVIEYLVQLPPTSKIFFVDTIKVAELPIRVGRIFYPIERRPLMPHSDEDVVIIGSQVFSPWRKPQELVEPIKAEIRSRCPRVLLENDYYIICSVTD